MLEQFILSFITKTKKEYHADLISFHLIIHCNFSSRSITIQIAQLIVVIFVCFFSIGCPQKIIIFFKTCSSIPLSSYDYYTYIYSHALNSITLTAFNCTRSQKNILIYCTCIGEKTMDSSIDCTVMNNFKTLIEVSKH